MTTHFCPRRVESPQFAEKAPKGDTWDRRTNGMNAGLLSCSWCGSIHPDSFMAMVESGCIIGPTDKDYKVYLHDQVDQEQIAEQHDRWLAENPVALALIKIEGIEAAEKNWDEQINAWPSTPMLGKFYMQHLDVEQRKELVDWVNAKTITFGYPGYFYVRPFFMVPVA